MARNLDTALLRTFVTVADTASMTAAANILNVTQGAVSQQIKRLEATLGSALLRRERAGLHLTPAGERLIGRARQLVALNDTIWGEMTARAVEGRVRLGVPYDLVGTCLAPTLKTFAESFPAVDVALVSGTSPDLERMLKTGEIDLAVIEAPYGANDAGERLFVDRLVWAGARAGTAHRKRPVPVSMVAETCAFRHAMLEALRREGVAWHSVFENGHVEATMATVRSDLAVTAWLTSGMPADLDILGPETDLPALPAFSVNLHLPDRETSPAAREMAQCLREGLIRGRQAA